jgi:hypothetical protein
MDNGPGEGTDDPDKEDSFPPGGEENRRFWWLDYENEGKEPGSGDEGVRNDDVGDTDQGTVHFSTGFMGQIREAAEKFATERLELISAVRELSTQDPAWISSR